MSVIPRQARDPLAIVSGTSKKSFAKKVAYLETFLYLCGIKLEIMRIRGSEIVENFCKKHADAKDPLGHWVEHVKMAKWTNHNELKTSFPSADYVGNRRYVFNIKGNNYRLIAVVIFIEGKITIKYMGTHAEYNKIKNIETI